MTKVVTD